MSRDAGDHHARKTSLAYRERVRGCLLGGAVGDALGASVEFLDMAGIRARFGAAGIRELAPAFGRLGAVTDDTQMTLFTADGLMRARVRAHERGMCSVPAVVHHAYLRWLATQGEAPAAGVEVGQDGWLCSTAALHNKRAPGQTCLSALRSATGFGEPAIANNRSKGCGGVMRVAPVGLFHPVIGDKAPVFDLGVQTASLTHGHVTGQLAAGHFAVVIAALSRGESLASAIEAASAELQRRDGHEEVLHAIEAALALAASRRPTPEDLAALGGGWVAEEALAIALCCALRAKGLVDGIRLAVNHPGDSDSTGAMTGNLLGAEYGVLTIPAPWLAALELRDEIERVAADLCRMAEDDITRDDRIAYPGW